MHTDICERLGIEYPIFAFTPSEKVAAAVSRAGGLGVLGCVRFNDTAELEETLTWLDDNTDGKPYGVDVVMPMKIPTEGKAVDLKAMIPEEHISFVEKTLQKLGVPPLPEGEGREGVLGWLHSVARSHVDVALNHRPVLIANALGSPPVDVIEQAHDAGVLVAALAGAAKHAASHVANGVDIIVAQGYEAGGHTGEIASMVLTPEIVDAVGADVPVLGAGGIGPGGVDRLDLAHGRGVRPVAGHGHPRCAAARGVRRHRADAGVHRQAGTAAQDQVDRGVGGRGRPCTAPDAAAEPARRRRAQPDELR
jgi:NAD(P)H-dependent flavin oxidoreductase YrpB (nitropropane dioxygenase family)